MTPPVIVIGAGMGGLTAALRLAQRGLPVVVLEARPAAGGLASSFETGGFRFDAGPYILLDRPGLEWAFRAVDLDVTPLDLRPLDDIYRVEMGGATVAFHSSIDRTAEGFERTWPGSGVRYRRYVERMQKIYQSLRPMLEQSRPSRARHWRQLPFLLRSLGSVLRATGLPQPVQDALAIWTYVAGQTVDKAPSPMAFVPALMHQPGCFYATHGIGSIPELLADAAARAGVQFRYGIKVRTIRTVQGTVRGVETMDGEYVEADRVLSNHNAVGTYLDLLDDKPDLPALPLQSPGVCAYLAIRGEARPPYLRFHLSTRPPVCRLLITPAAVDPGLTKDGWSPARLLGPMEYGRAEELGESGQQEYLDRMLAESWWREGASDFRVLLTRTPADWGSDFHLYRQSMNPAMTARFMRAGRFAHRSPHVRGLYLAGSSTHPGQWVSFCAISGVLAADSLVEDLGKC